MSSVSRKELYCIINRAVAKSFLDEYNPISTEMKLFVEKYRHRVMQNPQLNIFDDSVPTNEDIKKAYGFCVDLDLYHKAMDIYSDKEIEIDVDTYRNMYNFLQEYRPYIFPENQEVFERLESGIKYHIPEFRGMQKVSEYIYKASLISKMRKKYRNRQKKQKTAKDYESAAHFFFDEILKDKDLKEVKSCPEKIELYRSCIDIIDCLPADKYNRTSKFSLKCWFYRAIHKASRDLGDYMAAYKAHNEFLRYHAAIKNAEIYGRMRSADRGN